MKPIDRNSLQCNKCRPHRGCNRKYKNYKTHKNKRHQNVLNKKNYCLI